MGVAMEFLHNSLVELITQTSTNLPPDVRAAMGAAEAAEKPATQASQALDIIFSNIDMAEDDEGPICQDTGMPTFIVHTPVGVNQIEIRKAIREAVAEATQAGQAAPQFRRFANGQNSGDNLGAETPVIHFEQWEAGRDRSEADSQGRRLREQEHPVFRCRASWITWAARIAIWKACASACCMRSGRRRGRDARRARWASALAAIARTATTGARDSCSARWTM